MRWLLSSHEVLNAMVGLHLVSMTLIAVGAHIHSQKHLVAHLVFVIIGWILQTTAVWLDVHLLDQNALCPRAEITMMTLSNVGFTVCMLAYVAIYCTCRSSKQNGERKVYWSAMSSRLEWIAAIWLNNAFMLMWLCQHVRWWQELF